MPTDVGVATADGLERYYSETRDPDQAGAGYGRLGNGSLMRWLPTGLFQTDSDKLVSESIRISQITHNDPICTISCAVYNWMVYCLLQKMVPEQAVMEGKNLSEKLGKQYNPRRIKKSNITSYNSSIEKKENIEQNVISWGLDTALLVDLATLVATGPPASIFRDRCNGLVLDTIILAVIAVLDPRSFRDILVDIVRIGGDTDTNAAVVGGIVGARDGEDTIPKEWRDVVQFGK